MSKLYITVGLPGSGKSSWAEEFAKENDCVVHSSDKIREELYNNRQDTVHHKEVFETMRARTIEDLKSGKDVIYDATNLNRNKRKAFINEIRNDKDVKDTIISYVLFIVPFEELIERDKNREYSVGEEVLLKMLKNFNTPFLSEGVEYGYIFRTGDKKGETYFRNLDAGYLIREILGYENYDQETEYHSHTFLGHLKACLDYLYSKEFNEKYKDTAYIELKREFLILILAHDIGKKYCKVKEENDKNAHYYNHANVSAYMMLAYDTFHEVNDFDMLMNKNNDYYSSETTLSIFIENHDRKDITKEQFEKFFTQEEIGEISDSFYGILKVLQEIDEKGH